MGAGGPPAGGPPGGGAKPYYEMPPALTGINKFHFGGEYPSYFYFPTVPYKEENRMRTLTTDVVVISAGTAGLAASVSAAEQGLKVITVEKNGAAGGNGNLGNGPFAVESRLQRERMYTLTKEEAYRQHMEFTQWNVNGRLVKQYIDRSADTITWLEDMGVEFEGLGSHGVGMNYTWHLIKPLPGTEEKGTNGGYIVVRTLKAKAEELGVQFLMKTAAKKLIQEGGRIVGLIAEDDEGEIEIRAKAVISCAGGYGAYWRAPMGVPLYGDGLNMAKEVGADVFDGTMPIPQKGAQGGVFRPPFGMQDINCMGKQPNLIINKLGERFVDEERFYVDCHGGNAIKLQPDRMAFSIFSDDIVSHYMKYGYDFIEGFGIRRMAAKPVSKPEHFYEQLENALAQNNPMIHCADTPEALAAQIGVPADVLKATLDEYNRACDTGRDTVLGKRAEYLRPLRGRLYAVTSRGGPMGDGFCEGIAINHRFEVVTKEQKPIPGYYAAGMDTARSIWADVYVNILPGNAYGWALNSGRMSAEYAAKYIRALEDGTKS